MNFKTTYIKTLVYIILGLAMTSLNAQSERRRMLTITITNVPSQDVSMQVALHTEGTFMKAAPVQSSITTVKGTTVTVTFKNIPDGDYGILVLHNKNDNEK